MISRNPTILLYGSTGEGKSTLGNTLVGKNDAFKESSAIFSETSRVQVEEGYYANYKTRIIDTPGFSYSDGLMNKTNFLNITEYIKNDNDIQVFFILFNFANPRFSQQVFLLFDSIKRMFIDKPWYKQIALIFTKCSGFYPDEFITKKIKQFDEQFKKWFHEKIDKNVPYEDIENIPRICIDSIEARETGTRSSEALGKILEWVSHKRTLHEVLGDVHQVELFVKNKEEETKLDTVSDYNEGKYRIIVTRRMKRTKSEMIDGTVSYSDWEEIPNTRNRDEILLKAKPIDTHVETYEEEEKGNIRMVKESEEIKGWKFLWIFGTKTKIIRGRKFQSITRIKYERTVTIMSDKSKKTSNWIEKDKYSYVKDIGEYEDKYYI